MFYLEHIIIYLGLCTQRLIIPVGWTGIFYNGTNDYTVVGLAAGLNMCSIAKHSNIDSTEAGKSRF